jgi:UDP-glucose 4-epimerase
MVRTVFVTGGAGYIGSHCIVALLEAGYNVVAVDNFANCVSETGAGGEERAASLDRIQQITGKKVHFHRCDLLDVDKLSQIFGQVKY